MKKNETKDGDLPNIAKQVNELHQGILASMKRTTEDAIKIGNLLAKAKKAVGHGRFEKWIKSNCGFSTRTAQNYMGLAGAAKNATVACLAKKSLNAAYAEYGIVPITPPPLKMDGGESGTEEPSQNPKIIPTPSIRPAGQEGCEFKFISYIADGSAAPLQIGRLFANPKFEAALDAGLVLIRRKGGAK